MLRLGAAIGALILTLSPAHATDLRTLAGHVPDVIARLTPESALPETNQLRLAIGLALHDPQSLDAFLAQVYDPASPNYHQYLTPNEFTKRFGPTEADYAAAVDFARAHHLKVIAAHSNRLLLDVSGSVADVETALHVKFHRYRHPTQNRDFFAPDTEPSIDASLPIADVSGLSDYVRPQPKSLRFEAAAATGAAQAGSGSNGSYIGKDFRSAYAPGVALDGTGQTVGLLEFDGFYSADITAYATAAGQPSVPVQTVLLAGYNGVPTTGPDSGNAEVSLDIEMAMAMAPKLSKIVSFEAGPNGLANDILNSMASSNQIKQFSSSWGWGGGPRTSTDNIFKEMAAQGQSFFSASGDSDAFTVGANSINGVDNSSLANAPSSSPYITTVGGTTLTTAGASGGWVAETTWNWGLDKGSYVGSSGGVSSYYGLPSWQSGLSMAANGGSTSHRNIPDVAMAGDNIYVKYGNGSSGTLGGTSCAAPLWAAFVALVNQQASAIGKTSVGFANPALYTLAKGAGYAACFHDIITGNNTSSDSPNAYDAVAGYDLCTGLGTPAGASLIDALTGAPDALSVAPAAGLAASGLVGGPFAPASQNILLTNTGLSSVTWSLPTLPDWLAAAPTNGVLPAGGAASVTVVPSTDAAALAAGVYSGNVIISNETSAAAHAAPFTLSVGQSVLQNGGFETGDFTGWTVTGQTTSGGATPVVYDDVESVASGYGVAHSGNYGLYLGDNAPFSIAQTAPTDAGQSFLLSFWLENGFAGAGQQFTASWNGVALLSLSSPPQFGWRNYQYLVTGTAGGSVLAFTAENTPSYFGLDDISLTPVPTAAFRSAAKSKDSFTLTWTATTGVTYQVQYKTNLLQADWINLSAPQTASGNAVSISDSSGDPQRFYRLVVAP